MKKNNLSKNGGCGTCGLAYNDPVVYDPNTRVHYHDDLVFFGDYIAYPREDGEYVVRHPDGQRWITTASLPTELEMIKEIKRLQKLQGWIEKPIMATTNTIHFGDGYAAEPRENNQFYIRHPNEGGSVSNEIDWEEAFHSQSRLLAKAIEEKFALRAERDEMRKALAECVGVVQTSIVNAQNRKEYPAIIANLERIEAEARRVLGEKEATNE